MWSLSRIGMIVSLPLIVACDPGPRLFSDNSAIPDVLTDVADVYGNSDTGSDVAGLELPDSVTTDTGNGDTVPDSDEKKCADLIRDWMCVNEECGRDSYCSGYEQSCEEPPCWGAYCDFIPGTCMPELSTGTCWKNADCDDGWSCARNMFTGIGICRKLPVNGWCWSNQDCDQSETCVGEVACHVGNPCHGPEQPGVCVPHPTQGCLDDGMCPTGWCRGAVLCAPDDPDCSVSPGECVEGAAPRCENECRDSEYGTWCVGDDSPNLAWCAPPPADESSGGQCWDDFDCSPLWQSLCRSAMTCPPRSLCRVTGYHSGICGPAPAAGQDITLEFVGRTTSGEISITNDQRVVVLNKSPVAIYLEPCGTVFVDAQKDGQWAQYVLDWNFSSGECAALPQGDLALLRLAPGSGTVLGLSPWSVVDQSFANRNIRLKMRYYLGCVPGGGHDDLMDCLEVSNKLWREMYSDSVLWIKGD